MIIEQRSEAWFELRKAKITSSEIHKIMGRGASWLDTGTVEGLFEASNYIYNIEKRQGLKIACLEEIAFDKGWINKKILQENIKFYQKSSYADYLRKIF